MKPEPFGKYTLLGRLGKGGMAEVFLARAESMDGFEKLLAIKRLLAPYNRDKHIISMLADEARLSVWLSHPNIVQVLDFGRVRDTYYIAMEYVDGCDLCDLIRVPQGGTPRPLPLATALYVMAQVTDALSYAHGRRNPGGDPLGIIHRDVSPHNVLISGEGQVKLADFGLARASISTHMSTADVIRGKFSYMPREQAHGREIDHRIDIFAAGVTLYECLTGVKPYSSTTLAEQLYQLEQPVPPPSAQVGDIPVEVERICMRALQSNPEDRYQDAADMTEDLLEILDGFSTFNLEANSLSALVSNMVGQVPREFQRLPSMNLSDIPLADGSLIAEEVEAVRMAGVPSPESVSLVEVHELDQEEGDTSEFPPDAMGMAATEPDDPAATPTLPDEAMDGLRTMALDPDEGLAASSLPPVALSTADARVGLPDTDPMDLPPQHEVAGELPATSLMPRPRELSAAPKVTLSKSIAEQKAPFNTMDEPPLPEPFFPEHPAGGEVDDESATIQRSPEEALTAFNRALAEREQRDAATRKQQRRRTMVLVAVIGGAVLLFAVGILLGRLMSAPAAPGPAPPRGLRR